MALHEGFCHAPAIIDRGRDLHALQSLSGIWLCYRLTSLHELRFDCSHLNALVSFFYEAPSQRNVAVASLFAQLPHPRAIADAYSLFDYDISLSIRTEVWEEFIALIELSPNFGLFPDPIQKSLLVPVQQSRSSLSSWTLSHASSLLLNYRALPASLLVLSALP